LDERMPKPGNAIMPHIGDSAIDARPLMSCSHSRPKCVVSRSKFRVPWA
jgi:hypothetical protein